MVAWGVYKVAGRAFILFIRVCGLCVVDWRSGPVVWGYTEVGTKAGGPCLVAWGAYTVDMRACGAYILSAGACTVTGGSYLLDMGVCMGTGWVGTVSGGVSILVGGACPIVGGIACAVAVGCMVAGRRVWYNGDVYAGWGSPCVDLGLTDCC